MIHASTAMSSNMPNIGKMSGIASTGLRKYISPATTDSIDLALTARYSPRQ
ncbi:hypothetical protein D3C84_1080730 [compost metagenome]